jgi:hypothetical protein
MISRLKFLVVGTLLIILSACTTINVDHVRLKETAALEEGDAMVVLGRHQTAEIQTEASLVSCIGGRLAKGTGDVRIIPEAEFVDAFYPWFEARTAPLHPKKLRKVLNQPAVADKIKGLNIRYFVWVEGSTERTNSAGSMTCSIGPGGGGCFGFGTWEDTSDYETTIWDLDTFSEVEGDACQGMGNQLVRFFSKDASSLKTIP